MNVYTFSFEGNEYNYTIYEYDELHQANELVEEKGVENLFSHDKLLYRSRASKFKTYLLLGGSVLRFTEGSAIFFKSQKEYSIWLLLAGCIEYSVSKWGYTNSSLGKCIGCKIIPRDLAKIISYSSEKENLRPDMGYIIFLTKDKKFLVYSDNLDCVLIDNRDDLLSYLKSRSL